MPAVVTRSSCRVRVPRKALIRALTQTRHVTPTRSPKPILQSVRLEGRKGRLHLAATDLEMTLSLTLQAQGRLPACLIPITELLARVKAGKEKTCALELSDDRQQLLLNGGRVRHAIPVMELAEYPPFPRKPRRVTPALQIPPDALRSGLAKALIATSRESSRYALDAILLERDADGTRLVATDGKRLIVQRLPDVGAPWTGKILIPRAFAQQAVRLMKAGRTDGTPAALSIVPPSRASHDTVLFLDGETWQLSGHAVEGSFPVYTDVIPGPGIQFIVPRRAFSETLDEVAQATTLDNRIVRLEATRETMKMTVATGDGSQTAGEIPVERVQGAEPPEGPLRYTGGVKPGQIIDALDNLDGDLVAFEVVADDALPPQQPDAPTVGDTDGPTDAQPSTPRLHPIQLTDAVDEPRTRWVIMPIAVE